MSNTEKYISAAINNESSIVASAHVKLVGIGRSLLFEELAAGRIAAKKIGRRTVILEADLSAWLASLPQKDAGDSKQTKLKPHK